MLYVTLIGPIVVFILLLELAHLAVVGSHKPHLVKAFLEKNWDKLQYNEIGHTQFYIPGESYVTKGNGCLSSKWNIQGIGRIPRWSPWSKKLDQKFEELQKEYFSK